MVDPHMIGFEKEALFSIALKKCREDHSTFKAKELKAALQIVCPDFVEGLYDARPCSRKLKFIGYDNWPDDTPASGFDPFFEHGKIYESVDFNGATYQIKGYENRIGCSYFVVCNEEPICCGHFKTKNVLGFEFVQVGTFQLSDNPHPVTYNGENNQINVELKLVDESFKQAEESAYLLYVNNELRYVGEYSYNLSDRWLRNGTYVWHHKDVEIEEELRQKNSVDMWITVNPYVVIGGEKRVNISKSIEQEILKNGMPKWNKRGQLDKYKEWRQNNCELVSDIVRKLSSSQIPEMSS